MPDPVSLPTEPQMTSNVINDPSLPNELQGKTPAEVVAFYQQRETLYQQRVDELARQNVTPPAQTAPQASAEPTTADFYNSPAEAVKKLAVTREEFNQASAMVQNNMIQMAEMIAQKGLTDWAQWEKEINRVMQPVPVHLKTDPEQWKTAYYYVKGLGYETGVKNATAAAMKTSSEIPSNIPTEPVIPLELSAPQNYVASHLGLTPEKYREGIKNLQQDNWPITFDSRKGR